MGDSFKTIPHYEPGCLHEIAVLSNVYDCDSRV